MLKADKAVRDADTCEADQHAKDRSMYKVDKHVDVNIRCNKTCMCNGICIITSPSYWNRVVSQAHVQRGVAGRFAQLCYGKAALLRKMKQGD